MRFRDIVGMAFQTVRQQKARTALSCAGVVIGSLMLIVSLAAREGIEHAVTRIFSMGDRMRRIEVFPTSRVREEKIPDEALEVKGEMDDDKRDRLRRMLIAQWQRNQVRDNRGISKEKLSQIESMEHVVEVIPGVGEACHAQIADEPLDATCTGLSPNNETLRERIVAGTCFNSKNERGVLIHEFLAYQWGYTTPEELERLVGKTVRLKFGLPPLRKLANPVSNNTSSSTQGNDKKAPNLGSVVNSEAVDRLPLPAGLKSALKTAIGSSPSRPVIDEEFPIVGVFRGPSEEDDRLGRWFDLRGDPTIVMPYQTATALVERVPERAKYGYFEMTVLVDSEEHLKEVQSQIQELDLRARSLIEFVEMLQTQVATVAWVLSALAGIALFVSALGITNTMVMSVVERTHEIGVMKAVGARDGHILLVFLFEGALIGLLGAAVAVLAGWLASFPLDAWARSTLDRRLHHTFGDAKVVFFPLWLAFAVPAFSALVTTLAGVIPARRAARISPIVALRHE